MEVLLLGIYAFFVWLIFFKLKLLPWTTATAVIVVTIPIMGMAALLLLLNVYAPSALDVQVVKYVVQIIPRVTGRVIEVPVEPNRLVRRGDVLFRVDPRPFQYELDRLNAKLSSTIANVEAQRADLRAAEAQIGVSVNHATSITSSIEANRARLRLSELRSGQTQQLALSGAGDKFEAERWAADLDTQRADLGALIPQLAAAEQDVTAMRAKAASIREKLGATAGGEQAEVAEIRAEVQEAQWKLNETTVYAPTDGYVINLQLREGSTVSVLPLNPVMTFVEQDHIILALFGQNELHEVQPGNKAEIALSTYPGRVIKTKVDSIIWAQGQGQLPLAGTLPQTGPAPLPEGRFAVKLVIDADREKDTNLFLAAGARGAGAIYTDHLTPIHIIRKVLLRVDAYLNWVIIKHHISLH
jgi:multidrug resistance efflux pump